jgi:hypothetical protein
MLDRETAIFLHRWLKASICPECAGTRFGAWSAGVSALKNSDTFIANIERQWDEDFAPISKSK